MWGVKLEVNNAVMAETIQRMETDIEKTNETTTIVQQNRVTLAQLKERIDNANETLKDIKDLLRDRHRADRDND
jgi:FtsZ-binding cell division protein ZapB